MKYPSMKNFSLWEIYIIITKQNKKWKHYDFSRAIDCTGKRTCAYAIKRISGNSAYYQTKLS